MSELINKLKMFKTILVVLVTDADETARSNCKLTVNMACDRLETLFIRVDAVVRLRAPSFKQSSVYK